MPEVTEWYRLSVEQTLAKLETDTHGLTSAEAKRRLKKYGYNELKFKKPSALIRFIRQFQNPLVYILVAAAIVTVVLSFYGEDMLADSIIILSVVWLNAILGFFQEGKAENALLALQKMIVSECDALRDGHQKLIRTRELVPGDIVVLNGGDKISADLRLVETKGVAADESILTGESIPVKKSIEAIDRPDLSPGDQTCIGFSGTFLAKGYAVGVVINTAENTEFGKIASLVRTTQSVITPLQRKIADFTKILIIAILCVGAVNFVLGSLFGYSLAYSFLASVSLIVAAIPEMLPMIVTAILALAATTMAKRNALIRHLPAAETLGCTTVICSDKTGTLTKNEMTVIRIYSGGQYFDVDGVGYEPNGRFVVDGQAIDPHEYDALKETLKAGSLCNEAVLSFVAGSHTVIGDPTEGALKVSATKAGLDGETEKLDEIPFDSEQMYMATLHKGDDKNLVYVKGSPEKLLAFCSHYHTGEALEPIKKEEYLLKAEEMANGALRVISMAYKEVPKEQHTIHHEDLNNLVFLGFQGMIDPPREEAIKAVDLCKTAGIRTVMITGDHVLTAKAIAKQIGIVDHDDDNALIGEDLARMDDAELDKVVDRISVYARVAPEHKLRIAHQLQEKEHVVAMTGDGVNDAPALKTADIGVSMGKAGTEVSKEASSMVLTDDNFATIVNAVEEGRHVWNNLEKAILYTLPTNGGQAMLVMGAVLLAPFVPLFSVRLPLEPVQILWVNLFDSVFLTMPLMMESKLVNILTHPPRDPKAKIANMLFLQRVVCLGLAIALPGFIVYYHFGSLAVVNGEVVNPFLLSQAQTAAFWAILFVHLGFVMSARSIHKSAFTFSPFSNRWLLLGVALSVSFHFAVTYLPGLSDMFRTQAFPVEWWPLLLMCLLPGFVVLEIDKAIRAYVRRIKLRAQAE